MALKEKGLDGNEHKEIMKDGLRYDGEIGGSMVMQKEKLVWG